ncbi:hypothetical protein [Leptospira sp. GIMC2001]|uniref:hypothetical protein n=1 Tax=Leptospira sp. GIMC2001 TaxID=1513297 RepID=UPI00234A2180|nr:hypothetical protein [Leptospira sp. GIMC2001]WCL48956.1 hypothetical protein O4O04_16910 [Leptospira sp. GIMC2001]
MKRYRLTDSKTILGVLNRLQSVPVTQTGTNFKYIIESVRMENGLSQNSNINLTPLQDEMGKPDRLMAILKENRVELKIKQVNPFQNDLFDVVEILIEPLERSAARANLRNIQAENIHLSETVDIATILSLYGKTSIITQTINQFQSHLENSLIQHGYFIKKINVGFFYAATSSLLEYLSQSKSPYFLRDSHRKIFYTERGFFNPTSKMSDKELDQMLNNQLLNNIKSTLIVPLFTNRNVLLGYVEISSNMPNLGNDTLANDIESPGGISAVLSFLESSAEDFIFNMEIGYVKEWKKISDKEDIRDLSQDGRGVGIYFSGSAKEEEFPTGSKIVFSIKINNQYYSFYGNLRSWKPGGADSKALIGTRIHTCDIPNGINLLQSYANNIMSKEIK